MQIFLSLMLGLVACVVVVYCSESYKKPTWSRFKDVDDAKTRERTKRYHRFKIGSHLERQIKPSLKSELSQKSKMPKLSSSLLHNNIMPFLRWVGFYRSIKNSRYWYRKKKATINEHDKSTTVTTKDPMERHNEHGMINGGDISKHDETNTIDDDVKGTSTQDAASTMNQWLFYTMLLRSMSQNAMAHEPGHTYDSGKNDIKQIS